MASFTDNPNIQFNPYISQLPIEAMVQVGMQKQQRYDEGVQKIQSQIDNIAGLDIVRDIDKQYLQTKLNELQTNLRTFAAGDFSNFQLVNSVSGMTNQLVKDKNVQNAVSSTAWYRKQAAEMEKAISEGKSSQSNVWDFNDKASKWLSSNDINYQFKDRYTPYTDVKKKALEVIKQLHPKLAQYDIPFEIKDGKIDTRKIADAMKRYKIEGIDEGQIQQAIYATLTPDDINQLSVDARYQFRDIAPDQLVQRANINYSSKKTEALKSLELLKVQRGTTVDPTVLSKIDDSIEYYEKLLGKNNKPGLLDEQLLDDIKNAQNNPDAVKLSIYKDGFIKEFANAFSWKNQTEEYLSNPIRQQMNWVEEMNFRKSQESWKQQMDLSNLDLRTKEYELKAQEVALKNAEIYGVDSPWVTVGNLTDNVVRASEMFTNHKLDVIKNYQSQESELLSRGYSQEEINNMVNNKDANVAANALSTIQEMRKQKNYLESLEQFDKNIKVEVEEKLKNSSEYKKKLEDADQFAASINGGKPITLTGIWNPITKTASTKQLTPKEIIDNYISGKATIYIDAGQIRYEDGDFKLDMPRYGIGSQPAVKAVFEKILEYKKKGYFDIKKNTEKQIDEEYRKKLAPLVTKFVPQLKALGSDKDGAPTPVTVSKMSALITATAARGVAADEKFDIETASKMLSDKNAKDTRIFIQQEGENYNIVMKSESDPENLQKIRVSKDDIIANFGSKYVNNLTQESIRLDLGKGNTNLTRNPEQATMQKAFGDFPRIRKMNITADFDQDIKNPELFIPGINIRKKDGRYQYFELSGIDKLSRVGYEQGVNNLNALTDDVLLKYLKTQYPDYDYSQLDIK